MTQTVTTTTSTSISTTSTIIPRLYCFAVMNSRGYELSLMKEQLKREVGIFACDFPAVMSQTRFLMESGGKTIWTGSIGDMNCSFGGKWHLALNSEIFVRAWKRVFQDADYLLAKWTVKLDPDAVFIPRRLLRLLHGSDHKARVYFNNCDKGLHGPIEVIARGGMERFADGILDCESGLRQEWKKWGEDVFLRHCLGMLNVNRVDAFDLLSEDHCFDEDPAHEGCFSGKVAFHPFKEIESYFKCQSQIEVEDADG